MKRTRADYERLVGELDDDRAILDDLLAKNRKASGRIAAGARDELDWAALGYTIHNLYCCFEAYFLRIAKFFENGLDPASWHSDLLWRMTLELPTTRPGLFDKAYARRMDELRKFRHAFRNVYEDGLDPARLAPLNELVPPLVAEFIPIHERFRAAMVVLGERAGP